MEKLPVRGVVKTRQYLWNIVGNILKNSFEGVIVKNKQAFPKDFAKSKLSFLMF